MLRRATLLACTLLPFAPAPVFAQVTPERAQSLEQQIRDWLIATVGPNAKLPPRLVQMTADGDHFAVAVPFGDQPGITGSASPQSGGRWSVENILFAFPAEYHLRMPVPDSNPAAGITTYKISAEKQSGQMTLDPSFATPTTWTSSLENVSVDSSNAGMNQTSQIARTTNSLVLSPATEGRVNAVLDSTADGYKIESTLQAIGQPVSIGLGNAHVAMTAENVSRQRFVQLMQAVILASQTASPSGGKDTGRKPTTGKPAAPLPPSLSPAVISEALIDLTTAFHLDETAENISVGMGGMEGSLKMARIGMDGRGEDGLMRGTIDIGAEGLTLPELGLGSKAELIPTKLQLRPSVSGVPVDALMTVIRASGDGQEPTPEQTKALFARGGITTGLDSFSVTMAGTEIAGSGKLVFTSPETFSGTAQVTATNLDALQQKLAADPELAQAGPAIIFLKGIGRAQQNQMVWDVVYSGNRLLVNNQDLSAMMGIAPPPAPPPTAQRPTSPPPPPGSPQIRRRN